MSSTNISILTNNRTLAGSSRPLTEEQNEYSFGDENADDKNSLGIVDNETSCLAFTVTRSFYLKKLSNKKYSRSDMLFGRLNYSMNSFMKPQNQNERELLSKILEKKEHNESEEVIIPVLAKRDAFCVEVDLNRKMSHIEFIDLTRSEISLLDAHAMVALVVTKL